MKKGRQKCCLCLPKWLHAWTFPSERMMCAHCGVAFTSKENRAAQTLIMPCLLIRTRVHFCAILCHEDCVRKLHARAKKKGWDQYYDLYPTMPQSIYNSKQIGERCLSNHVLTGSICDNCGTRGEEGKAKLKICNNCKMVRYCDAKCQKMHWRSHKKECKASSPIDTLEPCPLIKFCSCFNQQDMRIFRAYKLKKCAYRKCNNTPRTGAMMSMFVTQCLKNKGVIHRIPTLYCSVKCREKEMMQ